MSRDAMSGKIVLVTGATSGIGESTERGLAAMGATVIVAGRSEERAQAASERIQQGGGTGKVHLLVGDLASQRGVRALARDFLDRFDRLDVLVNNAGVDVGRRSAATIQGLELRATSAVG